MFSGLHQSEKFHLSSAMCRSFCGNSRSSHCYVGSARYLLTCLTGRLVGCLLVEMLVWWFHISLGFPLLSRPASVSVFVCV